MAEDNTTMNDEPMATTEMLFPLFIFEGHDLSLFSTVAEAEGKLEGIDVEDGLYVGFDAKGRALKLDWSVVSRCLFLVDVGTVHISLAESTPTHAKELTHLIRRHLESTEVTVEPVDDLDALVEQCKAVHRYGEKPSGMGCFCLVFVVASCFL